MTWNLQSSPTFQYLYDVLGWRWLPLKKGVPQVLVLVTEPQNADVLALIDRMMRAVGIESYQVVNEPTPGPGWGLAMGAGPGEKLGLNLTSPSGVYLDRNWILTLNPQELLAGPSLNENKRIAWGHLQKLRTWMKQ